MPPLGVDMIGAAWVAWWITMAYALQGLPWPWREK